MQVACQTPDPNPTTLDIADEVFTSPRWRRTPRNTKVVRYVVQGWTMPRGLPSFAVEVDDSDAQLVEMDGRSERYRKMRALPAKAPKTIRSVLEVLRSKALLRMGIPHGAPFVSLDRIRGLDLLGQHREVAYTWTSPVDSRTYSVLADDGRDGRGGGLLQGKEDQAWYVILGPMKGESPRYMIETDIGVRSEQRARGLTLGQVVTLITRHQALQQQARSRS